MSCELLPLLRLVQLLRNPMFSPQEKRKLLSFRYKEQRVKILSKCRNLNSGGRTFHSFYIIEAFGWNFSILFKTRNSGHFVNRCKCWRCTSLQHLGIQPKLEKSFSIFDLSVSISIRMTAVTTNLLSTLKWSNVWSRKHSSAMFHSSLNRLTKCVGTEI